MMKKKIFLLLILTIGLLLVGCGKSNKETGSSDTVTASPSTGATESAAAKPTIAAADLQPFKIGLAQQLDTPTGVLGLAVQKGYLDEELATVGYKSQFVAFAQAGPAVNEAFVSGDIDAAFYGDLPAVVLKSKGIGVSLVGIPDTQDNLSIVVSKNSDISSPKDLEGKKVLVSIGTVIEQYWDRVVKEYGLDASKIEIVNDPANAIQTFVSGNADALVTIDLYAAIANAQYPVKAIDSTKKDHPEWGYQAVISARDEFSSAHPDVITALLKAYIRAYNDITADPSLLVQANVIKGTVTKELAQSVYGDLDINLYDGDIGDENIKKLEELNTFLFSQKLTSKSVDIKSYVNNSFYEKAKAELEK